jgi:hypothetical protein
MRKGSGYLKKEAAMKSILWKTAILILAFSGATAAILALNLQGFGSYLTLIFLGYCAIIVISHVWAAVWMLRQNWSDIKTIRSKSKTNRLVGSYLLRQR